MKIVFAGTPDIAIPTFQVLNDSDHDIVAVVTRPDAPVGRHKVLTESAVAGVAHHMGHKVIKASTFESQVQRELRDLQPDLGVVVAYGALLNRETLAIPKWGWINLHFSALPKWRGAAPVQWQIMSGEKQAGLTVFQLVEELDAGNVFATKHVAIKRGESASKLLHRLAEIGAEFTLETVNEISWGDATSHEQKGNSNYARKLTTEDGRLHLQENSTKVYNQYRAVTEEPGAFVELAGVRIKILEMNDRSTDINLAPGVIRPFDSRLWVGTATDPLEITQVQPAGKNAMNALDWFRGTRESQLTVDGN